MRRGPHRRRIPSPTRARVRRADPGSIPTSPRRSRESPACPGAPWTAALERSSGRPDRRWPRRTRARPNVVSSSLGVYFLHVGLIHRRPEGPIAGPPLRYFGGPFTVDRQIPGLCGSGPVERLLLLGEGLPLASENAYEDCYRQETRSRDRTRWGDKRTNG